ncbi:MAG: hypothetical protein ABJN24_10520 [Hyphomicrobiales bacterium]
MKAQDFTDWMESHSLKIIDVARIFGVSRNSITKYREEEGPIWLGYACAAYSHGLKPWRQ